MSKLKNSATLSIKEKRQHKDREPLFHLVKRQHMDAWKAWTIRLASIVFSLIFICILSSIVLGQSPFGIIKYMFEGALGSELRANIFFRDMSILLIISLAVTPAFKMKFWNIGAEGQVLISAYMSVVCMFYLGGKVPNSTLIFVSLIASLAAGIVWAVIPAVFKALWNTNETLFTLMMNYIALQIVLFSIKAWRPTGSGQLAPISYGNLPQIGGGDYITSIIVAIVITLFLFVYMRFSKHGYEVSVVGESQNTARYIGISVPKVIIRTLILSGAICAVAGFLIGTGIDHTISADTVGGRGFTAVLVSWLGQFNPIAMVIMTFVVILLTRGTNNVMVSYGVANEFFAEVVTGIAFLLIIICEFFIRYSIKFKAHVGKGEKPTLGDIDKKENAETLSDTVAEDKDVVDAAIDKEVE